MLKNKAMLRGLGFGMICGALLLQAMHVGAKSTLELPEQLPTSRESVGLSFEPAPAAPGEGLYTAAQLEEAVRKATEEAAALAEKQPVVEETAAAEPFRKGIYIAQGLDAAAVAERLSEFGIISDRNKFIELLSQQRLNRQVQFGYFEFEGTATLQQVIDILTTPP